jgi:hypothetical protein
MYGEEDVGSCRLVFNPTYPQTLHRPLDRELMPTANVLNQIRKFEKSKSKVKESPRRKNRGLSIIAEGLMTAKNFARLAALIFAVIAVLQFARALTGWPITVGTTISIPLWASWVACIVAAGLAWLGFIASRP